MESKYTKECEQNNNLENDSKQGNVIVEGEMTTTVKADELIKDGAATAIDNDTKKSSVNEETCASTEKRNVDAASPSLSLCSVQSGDSGKGFSLPRSEATRAKTSYEFFFPNSLVGQLYGRKHSYINQIKLKTNATVLLRKKLYWCRRYRVCAIEGTESEIQAALAMIRQRLPAKRYPNLTMQRIHFALPHSALYQQKVCLIYR